VRRRTFLAGLSTVAAAGGAGCLSDGSGVATGAETDADHVEALRTEITDRGVPVRNVDSESGVVTVEHGYDEPNDAVANVAMAFVERIADGWDVDRLEGRMRDDAGADWAWHVEAEWATAYADGDIGPDEYARRIRETLAMVLEAD